MRRLLGLFSLVRNPRRVYATVGKSRRGSGLGAVTYQKRVDSAQHRPPRLPSCPVSHGSETLFGGGLEEAEEASAGVPEALAGWLFLREGGGGEIDGADGAGG